jgi:hypothetical protein
MCLPRCAGEYPTITRAEAAHRNCGQALAQIIHLGGRLDRDSGCAAEQFVILGWGYDGGPAGGPVAGGATGPGWSFGVAGTVVRWSGCVGQGGDPGPGGGGGLGPGPGGGDFQLPAAAAAD